MWWVVDCLSVGTQRHVGLPDVRMRPMHTPILHLADWQTLVFQPVRQTRQRHHLTIMDSLGGLGSLLLPTAELDAKVVVLIAQGGMIRRVDVVFQVVVGLPLVETAHLRGHGLGVERLSDGILFALRKLHVKGIVVKDIEWIPL